MKRTIVIVVIFAMLIAGGITEQIYLHNFFDGIRFEASQLTELLDEDQEKVNTEENIKIATDMEKQWDKHKHYLEMLVSHTAIADLGNKIVALKTHVGQNDYNMAGTDVAAIISTCELLNEQFTPHIHTIL